MDCMFHQVNREQLHIYPPAVPSVIYDGILAFEVTTLESEMASCVSLDITKQSSLCTTFETIPRPCCCWTMFHLTTYSCFTYVLKRHSFFILIFIVK